MFIKTDKNTTRQARHLRVRKRLAGTAERPRLCVYRSLNEVYAQIIDDISGHTIVAASSLEKEIASMVSGKNKVETAFIVGQEVGKRAISKKIKAVVFDRGGYLYTGRVKALADGARAAGLEM